MSMLSARSSVRNSPLKSRGLKFSARKGQDMPVTHRSASQLSDEILALSRLTSSRISHHDSPERDLPDNRSIGSRSAHIINDRFDSIKLRQQEFEDIMIEKLKEVSKTHKLKFKELKFES